MAQSLGKLAIAALVATGLTTAVTAQVDLRTSGIEPLHGVEKLKGADLATVGVDIAPGKGFAVMRDNPSGSAFSADHNGVGIAGKPITSFIGINPTQPLNTTSLAPQGTPNIPVPGLSAVLPIVTGLAIPAH